MDDLMKTFDYDDQPVRVILRDDAPWLVAADVCRVLGIANPRDAVARLDEDEKAIVNLNTVGISDGIPGNPNVNVVSESGFYALVFTSTKPEAKAFRKWVTGTVLPALRRTGSFTDPLHMAAAPERPPLDFMARQDVANWLSMVREARLLRGPAAAVRIWHRSPLPDLDEPQVPDPQPEYDHVGRFILERCWVTGNRDDCVTVRVLCDAFTAWLAESGLPPMRERTFFLRIKALSGHWRDPETGARFAPRASGMFNGYQGIRLNQGKAD